MAPRSVEGREYLRIRARHGEGRPGRRGLGKASYALRRRVLPCAYLQTRALSRLGSLEKDDYLHRDTSSLSRPVYLLIYFPVLRVWTASLFHRGRLLRPPSLVFPPLHRKEETLRAAPTSIGSSANSSISKFHRPKSTEKWPPFAARARVFSLFIFFWCFIGSGCSL